MLSFWVMLLGLMGTILFSLVLAIVLAIKFDEPWAIRGRLAPFITLVALFFVALIVAVVVLVNIEVKPPSPTEPLVSGSAAGGHVSSHTDYRSSVEMDSSGKPVTVTDSDTTYYCLSSDGRILDIR